jgi:hypothetical protein
MMSRFISDARSRLARSKIAPCVVVLGAAMSLPGCKKDEPPPPLPVEPAPVATAEAPLELKPVDAGVPPKPAEKPKTTGGGASSAGSLQNCCAALTQNAASAPEPTRTYMLQAAAMCSAAAATGKDKASLVGVLSGALKGAGLPMACK